MYLKNLQLIDFRNFERLQVEFTPRLNFFLGDNGQGKTNLIEAVHLLSRGISFRPVASSNLIRNSQVKKAKIVAEFISGNFDYRVEALIEPTRKSAFLNGKKVNSATLIKHLPTVLFSPESLSAIKDGPDQRRQLIDELLISHDPRQGNLLREYSRAYRTRNRLLKNISEKIGYREDNEGALESLNKIFFILATHLTVARMKALKDILPYFQAAIVYIQGLSSVEISVDYVISDQAALDWSDSQIFDALVLRHKTLAFQEMSVGMSLVGPHKHDIRFLYNGNNSRFFCSQGQQRALILAFKIAQIVYHHTVHQNYPMLLLDDVLSELDVNKRINLMKFLEGISAQILITATDLTWSEQFGLDRNSIFQVISGDVRLKGIEKPELDHS
jgi:DNA replication and repair protein RecF